MKTISLIAQKGGAGKTTLSFHLAVRANLDGLKVLLVDIDPQASALGWWRRRHAEQPELIQTSGDKLADILSRAARQSYDLVVVDLTGSISRPGPPFLIWMPSACRQTWSPLPTYPR